MQRYSLLLIPKMCADRETAATGDKNHAHRTECSTCEAHLESYNPEHDQTPRGVPSVHLGSSRRAEGDAAVVSDVGWLTQAFEAITIAY